MSSQRKHRIQAEHIIRHEFIRFEKKMDDIFLVLLINVKSVKYSGNLYFSFAAVKFGHQRRASDQQEPLKLLQQLHLLR